MAPGSSRVDALVLKGLLLITFSAFNPSALILVACSSPGDDDQASPTALPVMAFEDIESTILIPSCGFSSCHGGGAGELTLKEGKSFAALVDVPSDQVPELLLVKPFDPDSSYLVSKLEGKSGISGNPMPEGGSLSEDKIAAIRSWIAAGAQP